MDNVERRQGKKKKSEIELLNQLWACRILNSVGEPLTKSSGATNLTSMTAPQ